MKRMILLLIVISLFPFVSGGDIITLGNVNASEFCLGASCISSWDIGGGDVLGSGTANRLAYWNSSDTLNDFPAGTTGQFLRSGGSSLAYWGSIAAADVPNLDASKITSGTFNVARIPSLDASKITSGTFNVARGGTGRSSLAKGRILFGAFIIGISDSLKWQQNTLDVSGKIKSDELFLTSGESTLGGFNGTSGYIARWGGDDVQGGVCDPSFGIEIDGVCWQKDLSDVHRNWEDSKSYCESLTLGGLSWEAASKDNWDHLFNNVCSSFPCNGELNNNYGFNAFRDHWYWTGTEGGRDVAWGYELRRGTNDVVSIQEEFLVACVSTDSEPPPPSGCDSDFGIVLPFNENLCWQKDLIIDDMNHTQAQEYCEQLDLGGLEWHLPEDYELLGDGNTPQEGSLLWWMNEVRGFAQGTWEVGRNYGTWLNTNWGFTGFGEGWYWSNTYTDPPTNSIAWIVRLNDGRVSSDGIANGRRVVCVSRNFGDLTTSGLILTDSSIYEDGNIGIGTNEPQQKLHVNGSILADAYYEISDKRLKENIIPLEDVSNKLMQINPSRFNFINQNEEKIGLIAQDLENTFPEFVNSKNEFKTIEYSSLVVPLIKAFQEREKKIEKQQNEINELRQFIEKLIKNEN